jgi:hypothetical protein
MSLRECEATCDVWIAIHAATVKVSGGHRQHRRCCKGALCAAVCTATGVLCVVSDAAWCVCAASLRIQRLLYHSVWAAQQALIGCQASVGDSRSHNCCCVLWLLPSFGGSQFPTFSYMISSVLFTELLASCPLWLGAGGTLLLRVNGIQRWCAAVWRVLRCLGLNHCSKLLQIVATVGSLAIGGATYDEVA